MRKTTTRLNFTKRAIEQLTTPPENRAVYYDSQSRGLGLMIQRSGHRAFFWFRKVHGRPTWKTIGPFPDLTIEQARARAATLNAQTANWKSKDYEGEDPFRRRRDLTLRKALDDYVDRRVKAHAKNSERAVQSVRWQFNCYLSGWGERKLGTIRRGDVQALHADVGDNHGKVTANRVVQLLRTLFNWALKTECWRGENPARGITPFAESSRTRFVLPDELPKLFRALSKETNIDLRDFVLIALFTGARRSDVFAMRWRDIDLKRGLWVVPEPKSREPYTIPLMKEVVAILNNRRKAREYEWVFPSTSKSGHVADLKRSWAQLLKRAGIGGLRIHDLRRTLGSWQAAAGVSLPLIGKSLGHQSTDATEVYARLHLDPVRRAIASATDAMMIAGKVSKHKLLTGGTGQ